MQTRRLSTQHLVTNPRATFQACVPMPSLFMLGMAFDALPGGRGVFLVALGDNGQPQADIERPAQRGRNAKGKLGRVRPLDGWHLADLHESKLQRRARRQALALMIVSSLLTLIILYGAWRALRSL